MYAEAFLWIFSTVGGQFLSKSATLMKGILTEKIQFQDCLNFTGQHLFLDEPKDVLERLGVNIESLCTPGPRNANACGVPKHGEAPYLVTYRRLTLL